MTATSPERRPQSDGSAAAGVAPAVAAVGVTKRFSGGVVANDRVTFEASRGEVHALLGENGAGKTTLCNILTGLYHPDEGDVLLDGHAVRLRSPHDAQTAGIFMVHQHLSLVESLTVAENVVLGWSREGGIGYAPRRVEAEIAEIADRYQMHIDPGARVWQLSLGERQRVDILKALYRDARILILDEPTTVLTPSETEQLFSTIEGMVAAGRTIIFISHKLPEVLAVARRVTILRKGRSVATLDAAGIDGRELARLMVGHDLANERRRAAGESPAPAAAAPADASPDVAAAATTLGLPTSDTGVPAGGSPGPDAAAPVLELVAVCANGDFGAEVLREVSLSVRAGEILGIAGVAGNGQRELAEVVTGLRARTRGLVRLDGVDLPASGPRAAIERRIAHVPEDRMGTGVSPSLSVTENLLLKSYRGEAPHVGPILRMDRADAAAAVLMGEYDIRARGPRVPVRHLSGGNVQKVVLARELSSRPRLLVAASPTRGLDVGATDYVRGVLLDHARNGVAILLISEDLDEIVGLSDRIAVLYAGRVVGVVGAGDASYEQLGLMMAGAA